MVRVKGSDAHALEGKADLTPYVLALVERGDVHVSRLVERRHRGLSLFVCLKQIELDARSERESDSAGLGLLHGLPQEVSRIRSERRSVLILDVAEKPYDAALIRPPGKECRSVRLGVQIYVRARFVAEARNAHGIDPYA